MAGKISLIENQITLLATTLKEHHQQQSLPQHISILGAGICGLVYGYIYAKSLEQAGLIDHCTIYIYDRKKPGDTETSAGSGGSLRTDEPGVIDPQNKTDLKQQLLTPYYEGGLLIEETLAPNYAGHNDALPPEYVSPTNQFFVNQLFNIIDKNTKHKSALLNFGNLSMQYWQAMHEYLLKHEGYDIAQLAGYTFDSKICVVRNAAGNATTKAEAAIADLAQYLNKDEYHADDFAVIPNDVIYKEHPELSHVIDNSSKGTVAFYKQPGGMINTADFLELLETTLKSKNVTFHYEHNITSIDVADGIISSISCDANGKLVTCGSANDHYLFALRDSSFLYQHGLTAKIPASNVIGGSLRIKTTAPTMLEKLEQLSQKGLLPRNHIASKNDLGPPVFNPCAKFNDQGQLISYEMIAGGFRAFAGDAIARSLDHPVFQWFIAKLLKELLEIYPDLSDVLFGTQHCQQLLELAQKPTISSSDYQGITHIFDTCATQHQLHITPWSCARALSSNMSPTIGRTLAANAWTIGDTGSYGISDSIALAFRTLRQSLNIEHTKEELEQLHYDEAKDSLIDELMLPVGDHLDDYQISRN